MPRPVLPQFLQSVLRWLSIPILLLLLIGAARSSQTPLFIVNTLARLDRYQHIQDIPYGPTRQNRLDLYIPQAGTDPPTPRPTVIFFYGGCWGGCTTFPKENYRFVAQALTSENYLAVLVDYRLYPQVKFPDIMADASQAVEWVAGNIADYGGDPDQIVLMGHSAGAHLAAMLTVNKTYLKPTTYSRLHGLIGLAGPYDFLPFTADYQRQLFGPEPQYPASQPINFVDGTEPPVLLLYGNHDTTIHPHNIESLTQRLQATGGKVIAKRYDGLDHAGLLGALSIPLRPTQPVMTDIVQFLSQSTGS